MFAAKRQRDSTWRKLLWPFLRFTTWDISTGLYYACGRLRCAFLSTQPADLINAYCSDIKPDNLLFDARGHIKLTDLGTYGLHDHGNARVLCMYCNESSMEDLESVRTLRRSEYENARLRFQHSEEIEK